MNFLSQPNRILHSSDWSWQFWTLTQSNVVSSQALMSVVQNQLQIVFWNSSLRINGLIRHTKNWKRNGARCERAQEWAGNMEQSANDQTKPFLTIRSRWQIEELINRFFFHFACFTFVFVTAFDFPKPCCCCRIGTKRIESRQASNNINRDHSARAHKWKIIRKIDCSSISKWSIAVNVLSLFRPLVFRFLVYKRHSFNHPNHKKYYVNLSNCYVRDIERIHFIPSKI